MTANSKIHEDQVDAFYSAGSFNTTWTEYTDDLPEKERFISFGYWEEDTRSYLQATKQLLSFFMENSGINHADKILNVGCGYGGETFAYFNWLKPELIYGVDITKIHTAYARNRARALGLDQKLIFLNRDAVTLDFPDSSFSHIFAIEGPSNFKTREKFLKNAARMLIPGGVILMLDIIIGPNFRKGSPLSRFILQKTAHYWVCPEENWMNQVEYTKALEDAGMEVHFIKPLGHKVFPGYARNCLEKETLKRRTRYRGFTATLGLAFISLMLGYLYKKGQIEYIYVKAARKP